MHVQRYGRTGRWFHAGIYVTALLLLATGWWFVIFRYQEDSPLATLIGLSDTDIHELSGLAAAAVLLLWLPFGARGIVPFIRETLAFRRGDGRWLANWPRAAFTGRFGAQHGHFDPGQRLANVVLMVTLLALLISGLAMLFLPVGGPINMAAVHRWSTFLVTPVILGHIVVASGVLPGYRGVWRSMHLGGKLPVEVAQRIWPGWLDTKRDAD